MDMEDLTNLGDPMGLTVLMGLIKFMDLMSFDRLERFNWV